MTGQARAGSQGPSVRLCGDGTIGRVMGSGALTRACLAVGLLTASVGAAVVHAQMAVPPPGAGQWQIAPDKEPGVPQGIDDFKGAFTVTSGLEVTKLHGVTQHGVNSGCISGVDITMSGSVPIRHLVIAAVGSDFWVVSSSNGMLFQKVDLTVQGRHGKKRRATGELRIYFPGGSDTTGTYTVYSNMTLSSSVTGTCNLRFSIAG
jgi:hypothetical protein